MKFEIAGYSVTTLTIGTFRLDGGAMFGSVPKNLWNSRIAADSENCIPLATRSLLVEGHGKKIIVEVGNGEKWNEKSRQIFAIKNRPWSDFGIIPSEITDVVLTHLHFDHAGGISVPDASAQFGARLTFPNAQVYLQRANLERARKPSVKDRASYLKENFEVLDPKHTTLVDGNVEILPGIRMHRVDGHTPGQAWIEISDAHQHLFYATDIVPTSHHVSLPFHMGYDMCAETILREKAQFLDLAISKNAVVVFTHDLQVVAARIGKDDRGQYCVSEAERE